MVFEHFPLSSIHSSALKAAEAADCANDEGKFWAMHDALFKNQKTLDTLDPIALSAGLDMNTFRECLKRDQRAKVDAEVSSASRLGVSATPTFFVGRKERSGQIKVETVLQGMQTFDDLDAVISNLPSGSEQQK